MPYGPSGNYSLIPTYFAQPGTTITTQQHNPVLEDIQQALSSVLVRDGRNGMVGNLDMGSFRITNLSPGTSPTDAATVGQGLPVGVISDFAGSTAPPGWLLCFGQAVSRTTYAALFAVIGTSFGVGDGSTTFNLPDCRGRTVAGKDDMGGTSANRLTGLVGGLNGDVLGATGGAETHTLTAAQIAAHTHTGTTASSGAHTHTIDLTGRTSITAEGAGKFASGNEAPETIPSFETLSSGAHTHTFTTAANTGGEAHNNVQPTIILNKIIKAAY